MSAAGYGATLQVPRRPDPRARAQSIAAPLLFGGICLAAMVLVYLLASRVPAVRARDASVLYHLTQLDTSGVEGFGEFVLHLLEPAVFVLWSAAILALALARGRPRLAVAAIGVMTLAPLTSEILKPLLAHPHVGYGGVRIGAPSWPSGHSTAALGLAIAFLIVSPPRLRPYVALAGALFAACVGVLLLILAWHMPSDVVGGYLVASVWGAIALAGLRLAGRRSPAPGG
jgi:membrane-associated phospholipid phosphatase